MLRKRIACTVLVDLDALSRWERNRLADGKVIY